MYEIAPNKWVVETDSMLHPYTPYGREKMIERVKNKINESNMSDEEKTSIIRIFGYLVRN